jgi:hypothetical protein
MLGISVAFCQGHTTGCSSVLPKIKLQTAKMDIPAYVLSHRHTLPYVLATCQAAAATLSMYRHAYCILLQ